MMTPQKKSYTQRKPRKSSSGGFSRAHAQKRTHHPMQGRPSSYETQQPAKVHPEGLLRVIALGGLGEVGRNMTLLEYKDQIIIVDVGFRMPEENMPGIDYIIPNVDYLKNRKQNIVGVLMTHGHYDHIGAIPYLVERLGYPTFYGAALTKAIVMKRQDDFRHLKKLDFEEVKNGDVITLGNFAVEFFSVNHNIPDDLGLRIKTPIGTVICTSDFKIDKTPIIDKPADLEKFKRFGDEGVLLLLGDSTGAEEEGHSISESSIHTSLDEIFEKSKGKVVTATFGSLINRVQQIIQISEKHGRKVALEGYSMRTNAEIAQKLGYLKVEKGTIIQAKEIGNYPDEKITVITTGAQGEENAGLMRIANREHRFVQLNPGDTVIFSSSVIPGNERTVQALKDTIFRQGADVFHYRMMDIHAGGHGQRDDLRMMLTLLRPKFLMPVHGQYSMLVMHGRLGEEMGIPKKNTIIADNGYVVNVTKETIALSKEQVPANLVMVDGLGIGDVGEVVLRDRQALAEDGIFVIIAIVDGQTGKVRGSPDIISRGFIYLRESKDMLFQTRQLTKKVIEDATQNMHPVNWTWVKDNVRDRLGKYLFQKTERRPMVLPVIIEV
ncbi:MAG: ribonuclease J [bacterium]|nr:ribonuclease J [bacterium]